MTPQETPLQVVVRWILVLSVLYVIGWLLCNLTACSIYDVRGQLRYEGKYGTYTIGSDDKGEFYDIKLKNPEGYKK